MKKIKVKRLAYYNLITNDILWGGEEYDGNLTDENILGAIFTLGKHEWCPDGFGMYQVNHKGEMVYRITVEPFYHYEKSWYDLLFDKIKRWLA